MGEILLAVFCTVLILVGIAGIVLPFIPGIPLVWAGFLIWAIGTGFERISVTTVVVFSILAALTFTFDFVGPLLGAKRNKSSVWGIIGAFAGLFFGIILLGFWGIIAGPFFGALAGELIAGKKSIPALKTAFGTFLGFVFGTLAKIVIGVIMAGFFIASWF